VSPSITIGVGLPTRVGDAPGDVLLEWARQADAGPFTSVAVTDRVVWDAYEPLTVLASAAGVTRRVRLLTSVLIGPTRETTLLARQAASIDGLSGGRLSLGLGIGVREDDYAATGTSFRTRGRRFDEQLAALRGALQGEAPADGVATLGPGPVRSGGPEILVGGYVDAVARRVAAWGDGYMAPGGGEPAKVAELWQRIGEAWTAAGRTGRPRWVGASYFALGPEAEQAARAHVARWYGFDPALQEKRLRGIPVTADAVEAAIELQASMGVDEFVLRSCSTDLRGLDALAELVERLRLDPSGSPAGAA
jgi:alkanesulfonate monooxygenase SsuD/methylene tetrahydromethanopterin reductase-like flavin-dependent oxidoreductase (luciferase family)